MLASSLFLSASSAYLSVLLFTSVAKAQLPSSYQLEDAYQGSSFFDNFDFFSARDPTNGYVRYVDRATAARTNLIQTINGVSYMGVDFENRYDDTVLGRPSVRIESKKSWTQGLFIADIAHMPGNVCGSWPAFWSLGSGRWPENGEIDIIEGVNNNDRNTYVLHTGDNCRVDGTGQSGTQNGRDCAVSAGTAGCSVNPTKSNSFGTNFNANGGGVYAMEWTSEAIKTWFFPRNNIPASISGGAPDPRTFGTPDANFQGGCDIDAKFKEHRLIFNTAFCGDWAGTVYQESGCPMYPGKNEIFSCVEHVGKNPRLFSQSYWLINSLKVYKKPKTITTTATTTSTRSSSSSSTRTTTLTTSSRSSTSSTTRSSTTSTVRSSTTSTVRTSTTPTARTSSTSTGRSSTTSVVQSSTTSVVQSSTTSTARSSTTSTGRSSTTSTSRSSTTSAVRSSTTSMSRSSITSTARNSITSTARSSTTSTARSSTTSMSRSSTTSAVRSSTSAISSTRSSSTSTGRSNTINSSTTRTDSFRTSTSNTSTARPSSTSVTITSSRLPTTSTSKIDVYPTTATASRVTTSSTISNNVYPTTASTSRPISAPSETSSSTTVSKTATVKTSINETSSSSSSTINSNVYPSSDTPEISVVSTSSTYSTSSTSEGSYPLESSYPSPNPLTYHDAYPSSAPPTYPDSYPTIITTSGYSYQPATIITTYTTTYATICPTGYTTVTATITATYCSTPALASGIPATGVYPVETATGAPALAPGFTTEVAVCTLGCAAYGPKTVTLTVPITDAVSSEASAATGAAYPEEQDMQATGDFAENPTPDVDEQQDYEQGEAVVHTTTAAALSGYPYPTQFYGGNGTSTMPSLPEYTGGATLLGARCLIVIWPGAAAAALFLV